jgi:hypothetical protein
LVLPQRLGFIPSSDRLKISLAGHPGSHVTPA